jgi:hypothetical protein
MSAEDEQDKLKALGKYVHDTLRLLKIGGSGAISCTKQFSARDIMEYIVGYSFYKRKWFETKHDSVANAVLVKRVPVPSFLPVHEPGEFEEQ